MKPLKNSLAAALTTLAMAVVPALVNAEPVLATIAGSDCSGVFGSGFANCKIPAQYSANQSPVIAKFDVATSSWEFNSALFPGVDATDFTLVINAGGTGTWTYSPEATDPLITFFVAKGGPNFNLFANGGAPNSGTWVTPTNPANGQPFGLSHITFYDTGARPPLDIPEPGTLALVGLAMLGAVTVRRRKS